MFDRDFLEPGCKFYVIKCVIGCHYDILRSIITAFDGSTNITVVFMAKLTDVGLLIVSVT